MNYEEEFIKWSDNNYEYIILAYEEVFPETIINNGDIYNYHDMDEVMEWAYENLDWRLNNGKH